MPLTFARFLTLHQPWATLMALGIKSIETRGWETSYRGPVIIQAGASIPSYLGLGRKGKLRLGGYEIEKDGPGQMLLRGPIAHPYRLPFGAAVAVADLVDVVPTATYADIGDHRGQRRIPGLVTPDGAHLIRDISDQLPYGDFTVGRYAWFFDNVRALREPIPMKGALGLLPAPAGLLAEVNEQIAA